MTRRSFARSFLAQAGTLILLAFSAPDAIVAAQGPTDELARKVDKVFSRWTTSTPGCAVGVSSEGRVVLERAYGRADLEHDALNTPETIFEAGSVAKQFTAAAVLLLARDGKLSLDDPIRKYLPELPEYSKPVTIRQMLQHTSGLRDWGEVALLGGWPRTTRVYNPIHVLEIAARQRALNFEPGTNWSYSNTGYSLATILVARVSGTSFAEFTRKRIFQPLGMSHTAWRDDFRRVVPGRAIAYAESRGTYRQDMPFENVVGNGGLLTTVGDLLRWNENFEKPRVGDEAFVREEQQPGHFSDGRAHDYGLGLFIRTHRGLAEFGHSGSTAGYRAYLARFPQPRLSVAVLCNAGTAEADRYAHDVADIFLHTRAPDASTPVRTSVALPGARTWAGLYRSELTGGVLSLVWEKDNLRIEGGADLVALSGTRFMPSNGGRILEFGDKGELRASSGNGTSEQYVRVDLARPTREELAELVGVYVSEEAETALSIVVAEDGLQAVCRPFALVPLRPLYRDAFQAPGLGVLVFRRAGGKVVALSIVRDRVWDMRFARR